MPNALYEAKMTMRRKNPDNPRFQVRPGWPEDVVWFSLDDDVLGLDADNNLYLDGKRVMVEQRLRLDRWVSAAAVVGAGTAVVVAVVEVLRAAGAVYKSPALPLPL